jgi:hypothetical protein
MSAREPLDPSNLWLLEARKLTQRVESVCNSASVSIAKATAKSAKELQDLEDAASKAKTAHEDAKDLLAQKVAAKAPAKEQAALKVKVDKLKKAMDEAASKVKKRKEGASTRSALVADALNNVRAVVRSYIERVNIIASRRAGKRMVAPNDELQEAMALLEDSDLLKKDGMGGDDEAIEREYTTTRNAIAGIAYALQEHANRIEMDDAQDESLASQRLGVTMDTVGLYALKGFGALLSYAASQASLQMFTAVHEAGGGKGDERPDLRWQAGLYVILSLLFNLAIPGALYALYLLGVPRLDTDLMLRHIADIVLSHGAVLTSSLWAAAILQNRRYFEYEADAPRAQRLLRELCVALTLLHTMIPYYSLFDAVRDPPEEEEEEEEDD